MERKNFQLNELSGEEEGVISGYASVFNVVDQHNDSIKPGSFKTLDKDKIKFLWQHKADEPIGIIKEVIQNKVGLFFRAKLILDLPLARKAYDLIKAGVINGVSIGFQSVKSYKKDEVRFIEDIDLWEISLVTFPANKHAAITEFKQLTKGIIMDNNAEKLKTWENFKSINDEVLHSIEQKGSADPLLLRQLERMSGYFDEQKSRLDKIETAISRPFAEERLYSNNNSEYKAAFCNYLRSGNEGDLSKLEQKSLSASIESDGGYLTRPEISDKITQVLEEISPMRNLASVEIISSSSLDVLEDYSGAFAGWTAETKPVTDTDTPKINKRNIPVFELYAQPSATQKLIDDSSVDIEKWLVDKIITSFSKLENQAFIKGDGSSSPRGILTYGDGKEWGRIQQIKTGIEGGFDADSLFSLYFALKEHYCNNASFLMNRFSLHHVRTLKDKNTGRYLWTPSISEKNPNTLLGLPVYEAADMPVAEKNSLSIAFGDFKSAYKIVDRMGVRVLRDPYTFKPFVKFYTTKRVGGDVINFEALKLLKLA